MRADRFSERAMPDMTPKRFCAKNDVKGQLCDLIMAQPSMQEAWSQILAAGNLDHILGVLSCKGVMLRMQVADVAYKLCTRMYSVMSHDAQHAVFYCSRAIEKRAPVADTVLHKRWGNPHEERIIRALVRLINEAAAHSEIFGAPLLGYRSEFHSLVRAACELCLEVRVVEAIGELVTPYFGENFVWEQTNAHGKDCD